jgi:hypothetical protein
MSAQDEHLLDKGSSKSATLMKCAKRLSNKVSSMFLMPMRSIYDRVEPAELTRQTCTANADRPLLQISCAAAYPLSPSYWQGFYLVALCSHVVESSPCCLDNSYTLIDTDRVGAMQLFACSKTQDEELRCPKT